MDWSSCFWLSSFDGNTLISTVRKYGIEDRNLVTKLSGNEILTLEAPVTSLGTIVINGNPIVLFPVK